MTVTSYPGVYMEEIPGGARPIQAAGTSTAAFFGVAERGPIGEVRKIFGFGDYQKLYGGFLSGYYLAHAVYQFFNNGGQQCYVGRVAQEGTYKAASVTVSDRATGAQKQQSLKISAKSPGVWGNSLLVRVQSDSGDPNVFSLLVYSGPLSNNSSPSAPAPIEQFDNLSMDSNSPTYVESVTAASQYVQVTVVMAGTRPGALQDAAPGSSTSGSISPAGSGNSFLGPAQRKLSINIDGDGWRTLDLTGASIPDSTTPGKNVAIDFKDLPKIAQAMQIAINAMFPLRSTTSAIAYKGASVSAVQDQTTHNWTLTITSGTNSATATVKTIASSVRVAPASSLEENMTGALRLGVLSGGTEQCGYAPMRPADCSSSNFQSDAFHYFYHLGVDSTSSPGVAALEEGANGDIPDEPSITNAFHWLDKLTDVSLIAVPGLSALQGVVSEGMNYCANRPLSDCFFIADMDEHDDTLVDATNFVSSITAPNTYGAVYFPWLRMPDPTGQSSQPIPVPPSGYVAGVYARTDTKRGVWKAPAGLEATLAGALDATAQLTDVEQGNLNTPGKSVCVIRNFPNSGLVLWGARTLAPTSSSEYKYIPVRRMAIMLRKSIYDGIQWAVFEGNDERLWSSLRLNIGSFMNGLFRSGAFQGSKSSDAYFVRCGLGDTMTQDDIDAGQVIVSVGFAPLKPAEFVIVRIQQKVGLGS